MCEVRLLPQNWQQRIFICVFIFVFIFIFFFGPAAEVQQLQVPQLSGWLHAMAARGSCAVMPPPLLLGRPSGAWLPPSTRPSLFSMWRVRRCNTQRTRGLVNIDTTEALMR